MEKYEQGTHSTNMGADKLTENTPNSPKLMSKLSAQAQKFGILMEKKASLGVRSPWVCT